MLLFVCDRHFSNLYSTTEVGRPVNTRSAAERSIIFQMVSVWLDVPLAGYMSKRQVLKTVFWCIVGQSSQMINEKGREEYHWYAGFAEEGEECKDMRKEEKPQDSCDQTDTRMPSRAHCKCDEEVSGRAEWEERPVVPVYCEVVSAWCAKSSVCEVAASNSHDMKHAPLRPILLMCSI
jgi:hypothetical protein